jgi:uncharacterized protein (DUF1800 family)
MDTSLVPQRPATLLAQPALGNATDKSAALNAESPGSSAWSWSAVSLLSATLAACGGGGSEATATLPQQAKSLPFDNATVSDALIANAQRLQAQTHLRAAQPVTPDALMNWAESAVSTMFPGPQPTLSGNGAGISYVYRFYPLANGAWNLIGVTSDGKVYLMGAITGGALTQFGTLTDYTCAVYPNSCPVTDPNQAPTNATEAARFLAQASLGSTKADITALQSTTYSAWIDAQMAMPQSQSHYDWLVAKGYSDPAYVNGEQGLNNTLWRKLIASPDTLRQRVTLALSEICVVSVLGVNTSWRQFAVGRYLDILENNAFGNYRTLLDQISLSPTMGVYLTFKGNVKASTVTGSQPDENYAREVMQLFTIGLQQLNPDGTVQLANGVPVETYQQADVSGLARVFTGWDFDTSGLTSPFPPDYLKRNMTQVASRYETGAKTFLGVTIPAGTTALNGLKIALDTLFNHPSLPPFICQQLIQRLVTSNPSPAYVQRVASVFINNGNSVRGDLKAVVKAILLDSEARSMANTGNPGFGKLREPMIRFLNWARAYGASSPSDVWAVGDLSDPATKLGQSPMRSPTVFNFFHPGYIQPGSGLSQLGLTSPELEITDESTVAGYVNFMQNAIAGSGISDVKANYAALTPLATDSAALLAELNLVLAANQIPAATLAALKTALDTIAVTTDTGKLNRVYAALTLVMASPSYIAQK